MALISLVCSVLLLVIRASADSSRRPSRWANASSNGYPTAFPNQSPNGYPGRQGHPSSEWSGWGANIYNNRWALQSEVNSANAGNLTQHCHLTYYLGVSATPVVRGDIVYYPTWDGLFVALNYQTCRVQWSISVPEVINQYAPLNDLQKAVVVQASRTSPQIDGDVIYIGTLANALLVALDRNTGAMLGAIQVNLHPLALVSMSPTVYNGRIFVGASSFEEGAAGAVPGYQCCSFIGNMAAFDFDAASGQFTVAWNRTMLPTNQAWSGGAIWGSQPSIDIARSQVFIGTGNVYTIPDVYQECQDATANITAIAEGLVPSTCVPSDVWQDSIIAFDMATGLVNWIRRLHPLDAYQLGCGTIGLFAGGIPRNPTLCPFTPGPDADFAMAPTFVTGSANTPYGKDTIVVGQKNGILHALSAQAGTPFWSTVTSPTGSVGGLMWGIAVDDTQAYFTAVNSGSLSFQLQPSNITISNSAFGAAKLVDGTIVWEVQSPMDSISLVPPSVVNDVVFVGRTGENRTADYDLTDGGLIALNKATGALIKDFGVDSNFHGGIAVQGKYVMFGTGYSRTFSSNNRTGSFNVWSV